jgi:hypothetical protein
MNTLDGCMVTLNDLVDFPVIWVCILFLFFSFFLFASYNKRK